MTPVLAASPAEQRGRSYAMSHCSRCHAIERTGQSPFQPAPPFRTLHQRYPIETLGEALAEGINTGHPAMLREAVDSRIGVNAPGQRLSSIGTCS